MSPAPRNDDPSYFAAEPPAWAARGLSTILLLLFVVAVIASVTVRLPETVSGTFVLAPVGGSDPVRTSREGTLIEVRAKEGVAVARGNVLFVIRSAPVLDREAELGSIRRQLGGSATTLDNTRRAYEATRRSDSADVDRIEAHLSYLAKVIPIKRQSTVLAEEETNRRRQGVARNVSTLTDLNAAEQDARRLAGEAAATESDEAESHAQLAKLRADMETKRVQYEESVRQLESARDQSSIRATALAADSSDWSQGMLTVRAPCDGTVIRVRATSPGVVVQAGDPLSEIACSGAPLQAEMAMPDDGLALLRVGQGVKLLYDAFPYQRFGTRRGVVRWVGPSAIKRDSTGLPFRVLIDLDSPTIAVSGEQRALVPGMGGRADIVVGRRALISYLFEPIRQLRENVADAPAAKSVR
jgi:membrane fusion protein